MLQALLPQLRQFARAPQALVRARAPAPTANRLLDKPPNWRPLNSASDAPGTRLRFWVRTSSVEIQASHRWGRLP